MLGNFLKTRELVVTIFLPHKHKHKDNYKRYSCTDTYYLMCHIQELSQELTHSKTASLGPALRANFVKSLHVPLQDYGCTVAILSATSLTHQDKLKNPNTIHHTQIPGAQLPVLTSSAPMQGPSSTACPNIKELINNNIIMVWDFDTSLN